MLQTIVHRQQNILNQDPTSVNLDASAIDEDIYRPPYTDLDNFLPARNHQVHDEMIPEEADEEGCEEMNVGIVDDDDLEVNVTKERQLHQSLLSNHSSTTEEKKQPVKT